MARLPLLGGAYSARSIIANCQKCINLYPELNPKDSPVPLTHYQRPGLRPLVTSGNVATVRGIYRASNGNGYCVIGQTVYYISPTWQLTQLGDLAQFGTTPVSFTDNGIVIWLVDGSSFGYQITMATNVFAQVIDPTGSFQGADRVDTIDTFMLANVPGTNEFLSTLSNTLTFDPTYFASMSDYPDLLQALIVNRHEILLVGALKTEIWYDAGNALFPFAELPGAYHEHGTCAKYSVASEDIAVYWLGQDLQGQGQVYRARGYECRRISNHALEFQIQQMAKAGTITDAIGMTYQQGGHTFYMLEFPTGDQTWVFDTTTEMWHQRGWTDANGQLHRDRVNCVANLNGIIVAGDWQNGTIYALDEDVFTDTVAGQAYAIDWTRTFPHIGVGETPDGRAMQADGKRLQFSKFLADLECGNGPLDLNGKPAAVGLRWSDDRGKTFGNTVLQSAGNPGEWLTQPQWPGLGIARDRVFELNYSFNGPAALNGAWVEAEVLAS